MKIHQLDIVAAYLNGFLNEEVFMEKPEILEKILLEIIQRDGKNSVSGTKATKMLQDAQDENKVCLLKRALYGLRQAGRQWHARLDTVIRQLGLIPTNADPCLYSTRRDKTQLIALIYVDDILICSQDEVWIKEFCQGLAREFKVKELGLARYCLSIEINQDEDASSLTQQKYIREILDRFHMKSCNPVSTPGETRVRATDLMEDQTSKEDENSTRPYRELIGALMYLAIATRPDIAYITSYLAQFNHCFTQEQWGAAKRILRYLQGTSNFGLHFRKTNDKMTGYSDAD
ncbi:retrovirus-related gag-pol polyprotein [Lasius niger]|uniref:Retrovirus-related gag-pol polyprotein n=1 Tax=Lasius niger TaxID=67767 RepID=A0A0J7MVT7_LASNI|nr:retrovirus-related gag-pol polyprotein [Lasius niger]